MTLHSLPPTNNADLVTLFEQRPWRHCPKHETSERDASNEFWTCHECLSEYWDKRRLAKRAAHERRRQRRISDQAEVMTRAIKACEPITVFEEH